VSPRQTHLTHAGILWIWDSIMSFSSIAPAEFPSPPSGFKSITAFDAWFGAKRAYLNDVIGEAWPRRFRISNPACTTRLTRYAATKAV
jgi:hypothetical protein